MGPAGVLVHVVGPDGAVGGAAPHKRQHLLDGRHRHRRQPRHHVALGRLPHVERLLAAAATTASFGVVDEEVVDGLVVDLELDWIRCSIKIGRNVRSREQVREVSLEQ